MPTEAIVMSTSIPVPPVDLDDPVFLSGDRSATYRRLRDEAPVFRLGDGDEATWGVSRYADVVAIMRDPGGRMQPVGVDAPDWLGDGPALRRLRANMAQTDRPVHTVLRGLIAPLFTARQAERLRAEAAAAARRELDRVRRLGDSFDAVSDLATQVPKGVLRHLIGMPEEDWSMLIETQADYLMIFSPFPLDAAQRARLDEVVGFYFEYFDDLLGKIGEPTELVRRLLTAEENGQLTHDQILSVMHTVLDAGFETTRTSISNTVELFAMAPQLFQQVRAAPELIATAVEESLRVRPPLHAHQRFIVEDYTATGGIVIPAGAHVLVLIGAANTDERVFPDADNIDIRRPNAARHMTFGGGLHHCLGAPLARVQLQETIAELARRFDRIDIDGPIERHPSLIFPSLAELPVHSFPAAPPVDPAGGHRPATIRTTLMSALQSTPGRK
jgi:cytochrome P450